MDGTTQNGRACPAPSQPWRVVWLLWPAVVLNYLDRQMLSTVRASIRADIPGIANDHDFGMLMSAFMWVYAWLSPVGGFTADRFGRRRVVIGSLFVWSSVTWATGHAQNYSQLFACRALMGISEAFYFPAALALIADFHPGNTRAKAVGIHQSGIYVGLALGGLGGYIAQTHSWRDCFIWFGAAGALYAVVLFFTLKESPLSNGKSVARPSSITIAETFRSLWSNPAYWILVVFFTLPAVGGWMTKNWLPTYLADAFGLKEGPAGMAATVYIQAASFCGVLAGGVLADRWGRSSSRAWIYTGALGVLLLVPALLGLGYAGSLPRAIHFMLLFGLGWGFFDCNNMPILCQIARPGDRATGYGFMNLASISLGAGVTIVLGSMRDHGVKFSFAFAVAAALALFSAVLVLFIQPRWNPKG